MDDTTLIAGMASAPAIVALVSALKPWVKRLPWDMVPEGGWALIAVLMGIGWNVSVASARGDFTIATVLIGVTVGLAASGLYSAQKDVRK